MKFVRATMWLLISVIGAVAFGFVTKVIKPTENVNALWLVVAALCIFTLAYRFYGSFLAKKVFPIDPSRMTPAHTHNDGRDYHPTRAIVLWGHHFAAIAGAGPLIGPILALQFGYLPGALWILIGSVFAGAVHDFIILMASVRSGGLGLAEIARREVGPVAGVAGSLAILFILIVALAGLGLAVVNALNHSAWGTFTIAFTIPLALFMGIYLYKIRPGRVGEATVLGIIGLFAAVILGHEIIGTPLEHMFTLSRESLIISMAAYGFIASVLPVWLLLCPRDYLSTYMKIAAIAMLAIGIIILAPEMKMPALTQFASGEGGPVIPGSIFPFLFITIACGAVSGFHSLVASGTTPKMLSSENHAKAIGFGAMLAEGFVSIMALVAGAVLVPGDYFAINTTLSADALTALGFPPQQITELSQMVGTNIAGRPGGAVSLAVGMAFVFSSVLGKGLMAYWYNFALMFEALFILTTVDTGTRVARFLVQEIGGHFWKPLKNHSWVPGTIGASVLVVCTWALLIYSGSIATIWPLFGVSNQLLAAVAFTIGTTYLLRARKFNYVWVTAVPMVGMFVLTFVAAYSLFLRFLSMAQTMPSKALSLHINAGLVVAMVALSTVILLDSIRCWISLFRTEKLNADADAETA